MKGQWLWVTAIIVAIVVAYWAFVPEPHQRRYEITVSKETTFITEPLRADGYVDYEAALNELASKGVTPENNAAVLLLQALCPGEIDPRISDRFFKMLGIPPPASGGKYYEPFDKFLERTAPQNAAAGQSGNDQTAEAATRPWAEDEFPMLAKWLAENEKPLDLVVAASKRPKHYVPWLCTDDSTTLLEAPFPMFERTRDAARGLSARAMFRLKAGRLEEARQDLLACHRIGRLMAQGPGLLNGTIGRLIEDMAWSGDAVLAQWANLTPQQACKHAEDLRNLPPWGSMADRLNVGERFVFLDAISTLARPGTRGLNPGYAYEDADRRLLEAITDPASRASIDWDAALREMNALIDRSIAAFSKPTHLERTTALDKLTRDTAELLEKQRRSSGILRTLFPRRPHGTAGGRETALVVWGLNPTSPQYCEQQETRADSRQEMTLVALALAAYRAEHGGHPEDLAKLVPKYLKAIPEDPFAEKPLRYRREGSGYVLYSVGPNGQDDDGRESSVRDPKTGQELEGDDIVLRMPVPKKTAR
jgi:hypothetical protein